MPHTDLTRLSCAALVFALLLPGTAFRADDTPGSVLPSLPPPSTAPVTDQGTQNAGVEEPASGEGETDLVAQTLALDIATASFYELADWCKSRGLPVSGSVAELRERLYQSYGISSPEAKAKADRTVTIERAAEAEYFRLGDNTDPVIRLSGGVILTVREESKSTVHRLEAQEVFYDRERNTVSAKGRVRYKRESNGTTEEFFGDTIVADLDDWSGIFLDGRLLRSGAAATTGERGMSFSAETMLKRTGNLLILEHGVISSCDEEAPHYSLRASKMWLLGETEWAIADAVLSVGEVPVLWLPFFYYPGDEIIFHPVFGYRSREGRFTQTTTYLIGEKPEKKETSGFLKMMPQSTGGAKEPRGLFLHKTASSEKKEEAASSASLKILADIYSSLGVFVGIDGKLAVKAPLEKLEFSAGLGLSRSIFSVSGGYSPYVYAGGWASVWNTSHLLGLEVPIRYGFDLSTSIRAGGLTASLLFPFYSDPFFEQDFRNRSEDMDWLKFTDSSAATTTTTTSKRTYLQQRIDISFPWKPKFLDPWVSQADLTKLGISLSWQSKAAPSTAWAATSLYAADPEREFFYPDLFRPVDLSLTLRGKILPLPEKAKSKETENLPKEKAGLRDPWSKEADGKEGDVNAPGIAPPVSSPVAASGAVPPSTGLRLSPRIPNAAAKRKRQPFAISMDWSLSPSAFMEDRFLSDSWLNSSDIDLSRLYRLLSYRLSGSLTSSARFYDDLATATLGFSWASQDQGREANPLYVSKVDASYKLTDYQFNQAKLTSSLKLTAKPLADSWLFGSTSLSYGIDSTLFNKTYKEELAGSPVYKTSWLDWSSDSITSHSASLSFGMKTGKRTQSLGLSMSLPPTRESYTGTLGLETGIRDYSASLSFRGSMYRSTSASDFSYDPLTGSLSATGPAGLKLSDSLSFDVTRLVPLTNTLSLSLGTFSASLQARQSQHYEPVIGKGWVPSVDQDFLISDLVASYSANLKSKTGGAIDYSFGLSTSYSQSLLRFSESILTLNLSLGFKVSKLIEITFSSVSQNGSAWRYWPWAFSAVSELPDPSRYTKSPLLDIWQSFSFWDEAARKESLFKLKSLSVKIVHDLHDWDLSFELSAAPKLDTTVKPYVYVFDTKYTVLLSWRDVSEIKTTVTKDSTGLSY